MLKYVRFLLDSIRCFKTCKRIPTSSHFASLNNCHTPACPVSPVSPLSCSPWSFARTTRFCKEICHDGPPSSFEDTRQRCPVLASIGSLARLCWHCWQCWHRKRDQKGTKSEQEMDRTNNTATHCEQTMTTHITAGDVSIFFG